MELQVLFQQFIKDSNSGIRLKKNGEKIKPQSIENYKYVQRNLIEFAGQAKYLLRIVDVTRLSKSAVIKEKNYWKRFYKDFTTFLYKSGCHDNYVGSNVKVIRTFFNYLNNDAHINTGGFHKSFYVRKEEVPILVLSPEQLRFMIHDDALPELLSPVQRRVKDQFVFGCSTGLRYSDLFSLTNKNFEYTGGAWYLKLKSKKTKVFSYIKLADFAIGIYMRYRGTSSTAPVFPKLTLLNFNKNLKQIGELAGFTSPIEFSREILGEPNKKKNRQLRFCDKMSSHMMRRTAITTMLVLGMPEHLVRKVSGHSHGSSSFNRYVYYAQSYVDIEINKVHGKLSQY